MTINELRKLLPYTQFEHEDLLFLRQLLNYIDILEKRVQWLENNGENKTHS